MKEWIAGNNIEIQAGSAFEYSNLPEIVGIATEKNNGQKKYVVYFTDERGSVCRVDSFIDPKTAKSKAEYLNKGMHSYYQGMREQKTATTRVIKSTLPVRLGEGVRVSRVETHVAKVACRTAARSLKETSRGTLSGHHGLKRSYKVTRGRKKENN